MENVLKNNVNLKVRLVGKIKGLSEESKRTRIRIIKSKSEEQVWKHTYTKYIVGLDVRHHLLAYAFLRGISYSKLEKKYRPGHSPNANSISQIINAHVPGWQSGSDKYNLDAIDAWLSEKAE